MAIFIYPNSDVFGKTPEFNSPSMRTSSFMVGGWFWDKFITLCFVKRIILASLITCSNGGVGHFSDCIWAGYLVYMSLDAVSVYCSNNTVGILVVSRCSIPWFASPSVYFLLAFAYARIYEGIAFGFLSHWWYINNATICLCGIYVVGGPYISSFLSKRSFKFCKHR